MKRYEFCGKREEFDGHKWLEELQQDNEDMDFIDGLADISKFAYDELEDRYGQQSDTPLAYHNSTHSFDAVDRGLRQLRIHNSIAPDKFDMSRAPSLVTASLLLHDIEQKQGSGENERLSAELAYNLLPQYGFSKEEASLSYDMIISTTAELVDDRIQQTKLSETNSHDPLCLIVASADINAIAMEGLPRLIKDSVNLAAEQNSTTPTNILKEKPMELTSTLSNQLTFFSDRLNSVGEDLRLFYDEETSQKIEARYKKVFGYLGREAIRAASLLNKTSLQIGELIKNDKIYKPEEISNMLINYVLKNIKR